MEAAEGRRIFTDVSPLDAMTTYQITKKGEIKSVNIENSNDLAAVILDTRKAKGAMQCAIKMLEHGKGSVEKRDPDYKTAMKIVGYYDKELKKFTKDEAERKNFIKQKLGQNIATLKEVSQTAKVLSARAQETAILTAKSRTNTAISHYSQEMGQFEVTKSINDQFLNFDKIEGKRVYEQDFTRHLINGILSFSNSAPNEITMQSLEGDEYTDNEKAMGFATRVEAVMRAYANVLEPDEGTLHKQVDELKDKMLDELIDKKRMKEVPDGQTRIANSANVLQEEMKLWAVGTEQQKNFVKMLMLTNQGIYTGPVGVAMTAFRDDGPAQELGVGNKKLAMLEGAKKILIKVEGNTLSATHSCSFNLTDKTQTTTSKPSDDLRVDLNTVVTASLEDLDSSWKTSTYWTIIDGNANEKSVATAEAANRLLNNCGKQTSATVVIPKDPSAAAAINREFEEISH